MSGPLANSTNRLRLTLKDLNGVAVATATVTLTVKDPTLLITVLNAVNVPYTGSGGVYEYVAASTTFTTNGTFTAIWDASDSGRIWHHQELFFVTL